MMKQNVPLCLLDTEITGPKKEEGKKSANQALCVDPTLVSFFFFPAVDVGQKISNAQFL